MTKTFTRNDLIRFLYDETSVSESHEIQKTLLHDSSMHQAYKELMKAKNGLDEMTCSPSKETTEKIIDYSKSTNLRSAR